VEEVVFRGLVGRINEPADEVSVGFSASFGLDFVWREAGLLKKRKRKRVRKKGCRWKGKLAPFELVQVGTKDLSDVPEFWRLRKELGLPRWQFSFRDVATGLVF